MSEPDPPAANAPPDPPAATPSSPGGLPAAAPRDVAPPDTTPSAAAAGHTAWARSLGAPVRDFLGTETGSAVVLVLAAVLALLWANVSSSSYVDTWETELTITLGGHGLGADLRTWVNEGLMTLFFLVVGLEAKRELDLGELRERGRIGVPLVAALGGMAIPVAIYVAVNAGGTGAHGWGTAMSTDTALALGVLALCGPTGGTRLRVFLLTLVVVDDLAALLVITVAYTEHIELVALLAALALFGVLIALRFLPRGRSVAAWLVGAAIWVALFKSGVDPVIAGLAIGLVTSAYPPARDDLERATELTREFREQPTPELAEAASRSLSSAISPNERLQYRLHPWTSYVIVPLFALANAGIRIDGGLLSDAVTSPVTIGIVLAYVAGKPLGIAGAAWIATRRPQTRLAVTWPGLLGTGAAAGVGFTVSLLIASLAFTGQTLDEAKLGVLAAALLSPLVAWVIFRAMARMSPARRARQLHSLSEEIVDLADDVDPARDHLRGDLDAPVTLVEYADFECPYCGRAEPTIRTLLEGHGGTLRYVFRHLPLSDVHPHAQLAAEASEAAAVQGRFWEMHDTLMAHQGALSLRHLLDYAHELDLDVERFEEDVRRHRFASRVADDVRSADASGVSGTPSFFVNGRRHNGVYDVETLTQAIKAARVMAVGTPLPGAAPTPTG